MARKMQIIIVALCTVLLLLGSAAPGRAGSNELNIGYNPDYGLMVGAEVDLQNLTSLPLRGAFEAYTKKYNLFLTALIPLEERLDLYLRPGVAERLYLGLGSNPITWIPSSGQVSAKPSRVTLSDLLATTVSTTTST